MATTVSNWPFTVEEIDLDLLQVDDSYQRPVNMKWVEKTTQVFDMLMVGSIIVNRREDGSLFVIDGQQRMAVLREVGINTAFAIMFVGLTVEEEAEIFHRMNRQRLRVSPWYNFRARLVARDPLARAVDLTVANVGFYMGNHSDDRDVIGAVVATEDAYGYVTEVCPTEGDALTKALRAIKKVWHGRRRSLDSEIIRGLSRFCAVYFDVMKTSVLHETMVELTPVQLLVLVAERNRFGNAHSSGFQIASILVEEYNNHAEKGDRLDPKLVATRMRKR